ncbi:MAG: TlpA family protein disulfide reductase [Flavobacteriaceae bacterium]|nr:TlpA family protein disulfide reductase [Flavobacteriaceae bacterium]
MIKRILLISIFIVGCTFKVPTQFSQKALDDTFITLGNDSIQFKEILAKHKGKKILIDVWASWCKDCIVGLPKAKALQKEFPDVVFLFLSLDKNVKSWKRGIDRFGIKGEHYFMQSGWKGDFGDFLNLNWIPRYVVIDEEGMITMFKATKSKSKKIVNALAK